MGLTGLDIYKQLPKKNCGECGPPTCLAFAMALASGKTELSACPYVSEEAKEALESASAPPIKLVKVGTGDREIQLGDEQVLFRHEKTFYHPTGVAISVSDALDEDELQARLDTINGLVFDRVGQQYRVDLVAITNESGDAANFARTARTVAGKTNLALVLVALDPVVMRAALSEVADQKPLLYAANNDNYEEMTQLASENGCPLAVLGDGLDGLAELVQKIVDLGYKELVLDTGNREISRVLADLTQIRRLAIKKRFRPFGYPTIAFAQGENTRDETIQAAAFVAKYASVVVTSASGKHEIMPLLTVRANIFTDPQKPIQVEPKVYQVGEVAPDSPVYVTTNFSLTYFSVEGEVEASKVPSYILAIDTDGTSVLTAWAAGKFSGEIVGEFVKSCGIEEKVNHREIVIPGHVAVISGKLEEASGWKVIVGPREAAGIPSFARSRFAS